MADEPVFVEDPPDPDLPDLQQRDLPMPTVPVEVEGKVRVLHLPNRGSAVEAFPMDTTQRRVLGADPKRARVVLVSSVAWNYARTKTGQTAPIPANVPITLTHTDEVYAAVPTSTGTLAVISEYWAD
jgi:hypothetical protein